MSTVESQPAYKTSRLVIVMGISGSGKSTIASALAQALDGCFLDADDFHPAINVSKMSRGEALTDEDRLPWLASFSAAMRSRSGQVVGACSALRRIYRDRITEVAKEPVLFVFLDGSEQLIKQRMSLRKNHFMPESLLTSQFEVLEPPGLDEFCLRVNIDGSTQQVIDNILQQSGSLKS